MAKNANKSGTRYWSFLLEFVSSLIFLWLVSGQLGVVMTNSVGTSNIWYALLFGVAMVSSIVLFFVSFVNLTPMSNMAILPAMRSTIFGGIAIIALVAMNGSGLTSYYYAILGFLLAFIGSGISYPLAMQK